MRNKVTLLVITSALLLALAFLFPLALGWMSLVFFIPIIACILADMQIKATDGIWWGIIIWGIQTSGLFIMCLERGLGIARFFLIPSMVLIGSFYAFMWFACAISAARLFGKVHWRVLVWTASGWCYFVIMHSCAFSMIGNKCGYPFALPILPLAAYGGLIRGVGWVGVYAFMFCMLAMQGYCVLSAMVRKLFFVGCLPGLLLLSLGVIFSADTRPAMLETIGCVLPPAVKGLTSLDYAQELDGLIIDFCERHPAVSIICMPESSYPYPLNQHINTRMLWAENALANPERRLLCGVYWQEGNSLKNALVFLQGRLIIYSYVKRFCMPFTEYVPAWCCWIPGCKNLFFQGTELFSPGSCVESDKQLCCLFDHLEVEPCLCSELFFDHVASKNRCPLLCLVNDTWFSASYLRTLMYLYARLTACALSRSILYISFYGGWYLSPHGVSWFLKC